MFTGQLDFRPPSSCQDQGGGQHVPGADAHVEVVGRQDPQVLFREASLRRTWKSVFTQPLLNADSSHILVPPRYWTACSAPLAVELKSMAEHPEGTSSH